MNGNLLLLFADVISDDDRRSLSIKDGDAAAQQVIECLAALVAMRSWFTFWATDRAHHGLGDQGALTRGEPDHAGGRLTGFEEEIRT